MPENHTPMVASTGDPESNITISDEKSLSGLPRPPRPPDILYQLWFEQFKQINTLAVAAAGGALILLQMDFVPVTVVSGSSTLAMVAAVLVAMNGQNVLVEEAAQGKLPGKGVRLARGIAGALLAGGRGHSSRTVTFPRWPPVSMLN